MVVGVDGSEDVPTGLSAVRDQLGIAQAVEADAETFGIFAARLLVAVDVLINQVLALFGGQVGGHWCDGWWSGIGGLLDSLQYSGSGSTHGHLSGCRPECRVLCWAEPGCLSLQAPLLRVCSPVA